jgi:hypothetical protein
MFDDIRHYVGLDAHKESIAIAVAQGQSRDEPRFKAAAKEVIATTHEAAPINSQKTARE